MSRLQKQTTAILEDLERRLDAAVEDVVHIIGAVRRRTMLHKELIDRINATFVEE